jgi:hypothetical protein
VEDKKRIYLVPVVAHRDWDVKQDKAHGCSDAKEVLKSRPGAIQLVKKSEALTEFGASIEVVLLDCSLGNVA